MRIAIIVARVATAGRWDHAQPRAIRSLCGAGALSCIGTETFDRLWSRPWNAAGVAKRAAIEVFGKHRIGVSTIHSIINGRTSMSKRNWKSTALSLPVVLLAG